MNIVLVEEDYKGCIKRYALTRKEFAGRFKSKLKGGMKAPMEGFESCTLRPMVHIAYAEAELYSDAFIEFFSDMQKGLSESVMRDGNTAHIAFEEFESLRNVFSPAGNLVSSLKGFFPKGKEVVLLSDMDDANGVKRGERGIILGVDDAGSIHVSWDNGSSLALIFGVDFFKCI